LLALCGEKDAPHNTILSILVMLTTSLVACSTILPSKMVTLVGKEGDQFVGNVNYDGPYSGTLTIENGPNDEHFSGRFTVIDRTAIQKHQGTLVVPQGNQFPAVGTAGDVSSSNIDATGFWYAVGGKGSKMECELTVGLGGHAHGICKHNNGREYKIIL